MYNMCIAAYCILYYNNAVCIYILNPKHITYRYYSVYHWPSQPVNVIQQKLCEDKYVEGESLHASCCSCLCQWKRDLWSEGDKHW